jgi:hypothetical protein
MLGQSVWFCGVKRAIPVTDTQHVARVREVLQNVPEVTRHPYALKEQDMFKVNAYPHLLSVIPEGARCYLVMLTIAGTYVSVLCDRGANPKHAMLAIPLRMDEEVYLAQPVFTCTFSARHRTLVVDDLVSMNGVVLVDQHVGNRVLAVHDMMHNLYRPDFHLLPLRIEVRRYFGYSQLAECVDLAKALPYPSVGVSIKPAELSRREIVARFARDRGSSGRAVAARSPTTGRHVVTKGDAPDLYFVSDAGGRVVPLAVKTMRHSTQLRALFGASRDDSVKMQLVARDGKYFID